MIEENKTRHVRSEINVAQDALEESAILFEKGLIRGAISRLYYFLFHMIRALLASKGLEPKSHDGVERLFSLHFVKEGIFDPSDAKVLAVLMKYRSNADYKPEYVFTNEDYIEYKEKAGLFSEKIKTFLKEKGYLED
ncbi:MAG: HEPN domain-containing protein [Nitrospirota bacterium]